MHNLQKQVSDLARAVVAIDKISQQMQARQQQIELQLRKAQEQVALEAYRDTLAKVVLESFVGASRYANLVLALGYAGFYALWDGVRGLIPAPSVVMSALFVGLSLAIFVMFEIGKAQSTFLVQREFKDALEEINAAVEKGQFDGIDRVKRKLVTANAMHEAKGLYWQQLCLKASIGLATIGILALVCGLLARFFFDILPT